MATKHFLKNHHSGWQIFKHPISWLYTNSNMRFDLFSNLAFQVVEKIPTRYRQNIGKSLATSQIIINSGLDFRANQARSPLTKLESAMKTLNALLVITAISATHIAAAEELIRVKTNSYIYNSEITGGNLREGTFALNFGFWNADDERSKNDRFEAARQLDILLNSIPSFQKRLITFAAIAPEAVLYSVTGKFVQGKGKCLIRAEAQYSLQGVYGTAKKGFSTSDDSSAKDGLITSSVEKCTDIFNVNG